MRLQQRANDTLQKVAKVRTRVIFLVGKPELNAHAMGPAFIVRMAGTFPTMVTWARSFVIDRGWIFDTAQLGASVDFPLASFVGRSFPCLGMASDRIGVAGVTDDFGENDPDLVRSTTDGSRGRKRPLCRTPRNSG